ncbi:hypothetical protein KC333_g8746 [Hortaea werneckii]|nr:hypothetical protein KC333_g8746 [Hortaea werneckii]KAI7302029.1 hypothetical protein KC326_g9069 [Hortaea werneckii]
MPTAATTAGAAIRLCFLDRTREFDFDWDSFMIAADGGIDRDISDGTGIHPGACFEHSSSGPTKATADVTSDVMAGSTASLHQFLAQDATANHATSALLDNAPTDPSLGDNSPKSTSPDSSAPTSTTERNRKRQRNTEAARRYRQRKVDRTAELEEALAVVSKERDELRLKLARSEAEAEVLRRMVRN